MRELVSRLLQARVESVTKIQRVHQYLARWGVRLLLMCQQRADVIEQVSGVIDTWKLCKDPSSGLLITREQFVKQAPSNDQVIVLG